MPAALGPQAGSARWVKATSRGVAGQYHLFAKLRADVEPISEPLQIPTTFDASG